MTTALAIPTLSSSLDAYIRAIRQHPVLSRDEEQRLACKFRDEGDVSAAHRLVVANLRFVVKVAHEYRGYGCSLIDLIQEGNIGLMRAVKKFDPDKGYRLISYAVWWIRAHIQAFIMRTWSLVRMGTGRVAKRLFFKLRSSRSHLEQLDAGQDHEITPALAELLGASETDVSDMELRLAGKDFHLDAPLNESGDLSGLDVLTEPGPSQEKTLARRQELAILDDALKEVRPGLSEKEDLVLESRLLTDEPETLEQLGARFGVTRERVRQIEAGVLSKLRKKMLSRRALAERCELVR